ncbi:hypothetical protein IIA95_04000 [Patescibacteria group bacterium]|nr:hypothetical protein [Patescibacteria group bacterium]
MKAMLVSFIGFSVGILVGYHLFLFENEFYQAPQRTSYENKEEQYTSIITGIVDLINYNENFIILSMMDDYRTNILYKLKVYFDDSTIVEKAYFYYNDEGERYFNETLPNTYDIMNIQTGDRVLVAFSKTAKEKFIIQRITSLEKISK